MSKRVNTAKWIESQNRWRIRVQKDGKRRAFYSSTPGRRGQIEANLKADEWLEYNLRSDQKTVEQICNEWLDIIKKTTSHGNHYNYKRLANKIVLPQIGHLKFEKINEAILQDIIDDAFAKKNYSWKTLTHIRNVIVGLIKYAKRNRYVGHMLTDFTIPPQAKKGTKKILTPTDLKILFQSDKTFLNGNITTDWFIYFYRFLVLTGLRPSELFGLKESDFDCNRVTINRGINQYLEVTTCKNDNARRVFYLSPIALKVLNEHRTMLLKNKVKSEYIFVNKDGETIRSQSLLKRWQKYQKHNGMSGITLYELRHTFISICKGKIKKETLKDIVGHSASMDTFGVYGHYFDDGRHADNATQIGDLFNELLQ